MNAREITEDEAKVMRTATILSLLIIPTRLEHEVARGPVYQGLMDDDSYRAFHLIVERSRQRLYAEIDARIPPRTVLT